MEQETRSSKDWDEAIASMLPRFRKYYEAVLSAYGHTAKLGEVEEEANAPIFCTGDELDVNAAIDFLGEKDPVFFLASAKNDLPCFPFPSYFTVLKHSHLNTWSAVHVKMWRSTTQVLFINLLIMTRAENRWSPYLFAVFSREKRAVTEPLYAWALRQTIAFRQPGRPMVVNDQDPVEAVEITDSVVNGERPEVHQQIEYYAKKTNQLAVLISHPANYIVKETPLLTPHEERRVAKGKTFPDAKRPRYIIVDHDVLTGHLMPRGTHKTPVPHQRRGHWMRLAERCVHAKAQGLEQVWVRPCYVGETDFETEGRRYQVLLDFQDRIHSGVKP